MDGVGMRVCVHEPARVRGACLWASRRGCVCMHKCVHECAGVRVCVHELARVRGACLRTGRRARVCVRVYTNERGCGQAGVQERI